MIHFSPNVSSACIKYLSEVITGHFLSYNESFHVPHSSDPLKIRLVMSIPDISKKFSTWNAWTTSIKIYRSVNWEHFNVHVHMNDPLHLWSNWPVFQILNILIILPLCHGSSINYHLIDVWRDRRQNNEYDN